MRILSLRPLTINRSLAGAIATFGRRWRDLWQVRAIMSGIVAAER